MNGYWVLKTCMGEVHSILTVHNIQFNWIYINKWTNIEIWKHVHWVWQMSVVYFDKWTACGTTVCWLKNTTDEFQLFLLVCWKIFLWRFLLWDWDLNIYFQCAQKDIHKIKILQRRINYLLVNSILKIMVHLQMLYSQFEDQQVAPPK